MDETSTEQASRKRGRYTHPVWRILCEESEAEEAHTMQQSSCKYCGDIVRHGAHWDRALKHLAIKCRSTCEETKNDLYKAYPNELSKSNSKPNGTSATWPLEAQKNFEFILSMWVYVNDQPFSIVDNPLFREMIKTLNPNATLPSAEKLSNSWLDEAYNETKKCVLEKIQNSQAGFTASSDGTSDINRKSVFNILISNKNDSFLLQSKDASSFSHTGEKISDLVVNAVKEFHAEEKVVAINSDNTTANMKSWDRTETNLPKVMSFGCQAHNCNLLVKDLCKFKASFNNIPNPSTIPTENVNPDENQSPNPQPHPPSTTRTSSSRSSSRRIQNPRSNDSTSTSSQHPLVEELADTVALCKDVTIFYRNHSRQLDLLLSHQKAAGVKHLALPGDTRWKSYHRCVESAKDSFICISLCMMDSRFLEKAKNF